MHKELVSAPAVVFCRPSQAYCTWAFRFLGISAFCFKNIYLKLWTQSVGMLFDNLNECGYNPDAQGLRRLCNMQAPKPQAACMQKACMFAPCETLGCCGAENAGPSNQTCAIVLCRSGPCRLESFVLNRACRIVALVSRHTSFPVWIGLGIWGC